MIVIPILLIALFFKPLGSKFTVILLSEGSYFVFGILLLQLLVVRLYINPKRIPEKDTPQAAPFIRRLEFLPVLMSIMMFISHMLGYLVAAYNLGRHGFVLDTSSFFYGFTIFILFCMIKIPLLYLIVNRYSYELAVKFLVARDQHNSYARKRFIPGNTGIAIFLGVSSPILAVFIAVLYYHLNSITDAAPVPYLTFAVIGFFFIIISGFLLNLFLMGVSEITKDLPVLNQTIDESFIKQFSITQREKEVIELVLQGYSPQEISARLFISQNTVKNHLSNIYHKAEVTNRNQLVFRIFHQSGGEADF
ncbi:MAG: hypothetical protein HPY53_03830 [Brevinematales bacterium]|nr:hypothetical protein [Brevinematales bacterium]